MLLSQIFLHESLLQIFTFFFRLFLPYYMYNLRETFMYFLQMEAAFGLILNWLPFKDIVLTIIHIIKEIYESKPRDIYTKPAFTQY